MTSLIILVLLMISCTSSTSLSLKDRETLASSLATSSNDVNFASFEEIPKFSSTTNDVGTSSENFETSEKMSKNDQDNDEDEEQIVNNASSSDDVQLDRLTLKKGRKRKTLFHNYPQVPRMLNRKQSIVTSYDKNLQNYDNTEGRKKLSNKKRYQQESQIYYIKLPPTPYTYVPGFGYISQPPTYSSPGLHQRPAGLNHSPRPTRPHANHNNNNNNNKKTTSNNNSFIKVPVDFVSNGKPTGVYQWPTKRRHSTINRLNDGPYVFNGRPTSLYLLNSDGRKTGHQPIRLEEKSNDPYY